MPQRTAGEGVGDNISPELNWEGLPAETRELLLVVEDPSVPLPRPIVHMVAFGIDPVLKGLPEGALSVEMAPSFGLRFGYGTAGRIGYKGPRPIPGHGPHEYHFELFAINRKIESDCMDLSRLLTVIEGAVIGKGRLIGRYER
jgi:hypothetical protein